MTASAKMFLVAQTVDGPGPLAPTGTILRLTAAARLVALPWVSLMVINAPPALTVNAQAVLSAGGLGPSALRGVTLKPIAAAKQGTLMTSLTPMVTNAQTEMMVTAQAVMSAGGRGPKVQTGTTLMRLAGARL